MTALDNQIATVNIGGQQCRCGMGFFQPFKNGKALSQRFRRRAFERRHCTCRVNGAKRRRVLMALREIVRALFERHALEVQCNAHSVSGKG